MTTQTQKRKVSDTMGALIVAGVIGLFIIIYGGVWMVLSYQDSALQSDYDRLSFKLNVAACHGDYLCEQRVFHHHQLEQEIK